MNQEEIKSFNDALLNAGITDADEFWEQRVIDIYYLVERDTELLISAFKTLLDRVTYPKQRRLEEKYNTYQFFDVFADYYNEEKVLVDMALTNEGYDQSLLSDITVKQLFAIEGLYSNNINVFIEKIIQAYRNEYGY